MEYKDTKVANNNVIRRSLYEDDEIESLKKRYQEAGPYPHCIVSDFCDSDTLRRVRQEIIENFDATYKETDLFKMLQTVDLANLDGMDEEKKAKIPCLMALRDEIYSKEFREFVSKVTGCGDLSDVTDCACNIHPVGGHLLCHDDVIGDRRVSYIIYLTDPDMGWKEEDGGALELYPEDPERPMVPHPTPTAKALPVWNSMAMFKVQAGKSFHSIQEVMTSEKPRMSLQGWFHGSGQVTGKQDEDMESVKALPTLAMLQEKMIQDDLEKYKDFRSVCDGDTVVDAVADEDFTLSEKDVEYLSQWINPMYLTGKGMPKIQAKFEEDGSIQLLNFLKTEKAELIREAMVQADEEDKVGHGIMPDYTSGAGDGWAVKGPAHMQRYMEYSNKDSSNGMTSSIHSSGKKRMGEMLKEVYDEVISTRPFCNLIRRFTTLTMLGCQGEVRRFRPGLDYTVAHYGGLTKDPRMDVVLCFVNDQSGDDCWGDGECGGFEAYLLADEEEDGPAEVYRQVHDDDTGVLNVSPQFNSLNIVLRDEGLMRFVKYLSSSAPGSRWDISAVMLPVDDDTDDE